jgi:hypothetical protein
MYPLRKSQIPGLGILDHSHIVHVELTLRVLGRHTAHEDSERLEDFWRDGDMLAAFVLLGLPMAMTCFRCC